VTNPIGKLLCLGAGAALLGGCVGGNPLVNNSSVKIRTSPAGALATSEYGDSCKTPCSLRLRTSKGGTIRISKAGYEDETLSIGTHFDEAGLAMEGVRQASRPDAFGLAVEGLFTLLDRKGQYRKLDTRRVNVALLPMGSTPAPREVPLASAAAPAQPAAGGGTVRRLSREQIEAIIGPPLPSEAAAVTASSSPPRRSR
jgi:hypothetical protein